MRSLSTKPGKVIELSGSLTIREAARLHHTFQALTTAEPGDVTLGMREVTDLDCAGLQLLLALGRALDDRGRTLRLNGLSRPLQQVLEESGAGRHLDHDAGVDG